VLNFSKGELLFKVFYRQVYKCLKTQAISEQKINLVLLLAKVLKVQLLNDLQKSSLKT